MSRKIGVSKTEMLHMRAEGLSNKDIANLLEIHPSTVYNYIGPQGGRMDDLVAFAELKTATTETPKEELKAVPKAAESLKRVYETLKSADGAFRADVDYENKCVAMFDGTMTFEQVAELAIFVVGLASRIENEVKN